MNAQLTNTNTSTTRIIEVGGIKMEVDLRNAKVIENYKVGDKVKVLKKDYSDDYKSFPGVIIGFDDFKKLPSILIAYLDADYSSSKVSFLTLNDQTKDFEICSMNEIDKQFSKADALFQLDRQIDNKKEEVRELEQKRKYFESTFHTYFEKSNSEIKGEK